jgi:hypothetical protein
MGMVGGGPSGMPVFTAVGNVTVAGASSPATNIVVLAGVANHSLLIHTVSVTVQSSVSGGIDVKFHGSNGVLDLGLVPIGGTGTFLCQEYVCDTLLGIGEALQVDITSGAATITTYSVNATYKVI